MECLASIIELIDVQSFSYVHAHNHNPGYPTDPSYYAQLQLLMVSGYVDVGDPVLLSDQTWGRRATTALDLRLNPGTYHFRWDPRGLACGSNTEGEFFAIDDLVISVRRFEFFQPIAVLAAARYCGAATTYSLLSPKISKASSRIDRSSGKIGQLRMPRPS